MEKVGLGRGVGGIAWGYPRPLICNIRLAAAGSRQDFQDLTCEVFAGKGFILIPGGGGCPYQPRSLKKKARQLLLPEARVGPTTDPSRTPLPCRLVLLPLRPVRIEVHVPLREGDGYPMLPEQGVDLIADGAFDPRV